jgi:hypothetical protein
MHKQIIITESSVRLDALANNYFGTGIDYLFYD